MRKAFLALLAPALAVTLVIAPAAPARVAAATTSTAKVAVIVGETGSSNSYYLSEANKLAATARLYTPNVSLVATPHATWAAAKAAMQGASVVAYFGHGNGSPSPYGPFNSSSVDGMGLNTTDGTYTLKYYGESYFANEIRFAPNAVVLLGHLCYASGNYEGELPDGPITYGWQRLDNFAAGFQASGAKAVMASAYDGALNYYLSALFTTHQSIDALWKAAPDKHGHVVSTPSYRTPGTLDVMDPTNADLSQRWRSLAGATSTLTDSVVKAWTPTNTASASIVVPGNAIVPAAAPLFADALLTKPAAVASLPAGTRVRVASQGAPLAAGTAVYAVTSTSPAATGYLPATALQPGDNTAPIVWTADSSRGAFSPNADGSRDTGSFAARFSEPVTASLVIKNAAGTQVDAASYMSDSFGIVTGSWDGLSASGVAQPDGTYGWTLTARDAWGSGPATATGTFVIDRVAPALSSPAKGGTYQLSTVAGSTVSTTYTASEPGYVQVRVTNKAGSVVRSYPTTTGSVSWSAETDLVGTAPEGTYTVTMRAYDAAGNASAPVAFTVIRSGAITSWKALESYAYNDGIATDFAYYIGKPVTTTVTIRNSAGTVVKSDPARNLTYVGGPYNSTWNGLDLAGKPAPAGTYTAELVAVTADGTTAKATTTIVLDQLRVVPAASSATRGTYLTVRYYSKATLSSPYIAATQPGLATTWTPMRLESAGVYVANVKIQAGAAGTMTMYGYGIDPWGRTHRTYLTLPLK